tara:strand:- start:473 stop:691 length:219 start_codon:yes stop_codon:yes gene_type:complete
LALPWYCSAANSYLPLSLGDGLRSVAKRSGNHPHPNLVLSAGSPVAQHGFYAGAFGTPSMFGDARWLWYNFS